MKLRVIRARGTEAIARLPEPSDVDFVRAGVQAPSCFGSMARVTRVFARTPGESVHYYTAFGAGTGAGVSNSMVAGRLMRSVALTNALDSAACDKLEEDMNNEE